MKHMIALATRFLVIVRGYLVASVVAGIVMAFWFLSFALTQRGAGAAAVLFLFLPWVICAAVIYVVAITAIPTLAFIAIAEAYQLDPALPYVAFAVTMALFGFALSGFYSWGDGAAFFCTCLLIAGYTAGSIYWALAGQMAGEGCEPR
jgi:hypothetical protein